MTIEFEVKYNLSEYLQFVSETAHVRISEMLAAKGKKTPGKIATFTINALLPFIATIAFIYKINRVGICRFSISHLVITRYAKTSDLVIPWTEVVSVQRCTPGLLLNKTKGGIPVPFRCLSASQLIELEKFIHDNGISIKSAI